MSSTRLPPLHQAAPEAAAPITDALRASLEEDEVAIGGMSAVATIRFRPLVPS